MKKLISLAICFVILLSITACDNHNDSMDFSKNPVSPTVLPHELFLSPHTGSTIRASQISVGSDCLQTSATLTLQGWMQHWAVPPERIIDGLYGSFFNFTPYGDQPGEVILTWSQPQSISLIQIYASGLWAYWNIDVAYKTSPEEVLWQPLPTNWENSPLYPPETWPVLLSSNFPAISATAIRISIRNLGSYPSLYLSEFGIFGAPIAFKNCLPN